MSAPSVDYNSFDEASLADPYARYIALVEAGPIPWLEKIGAFEMGRFAEVQVALRGHQPAPAQQHAPCDRESSGREHA